MYIYYIYAVYYVCKQKQGLTFMQECLPTIIIPVWARCLLCYSTREQKESVGLDYSICWGMRNAHMYNRMLLRSISSSSLHWSLLPLPRLVWFLYTTSFAQQQQQQQHHLYIPSHFALRKNGNFEICVHCNLLLWQNNPYLPSASRRHSFFIVLVEWHQIFLLYFFLSYLLLFICKYYLFYITVVKIFHIYMY